MLERLELRSMLAGWSARVDFSTFSGMAMRPYEERVMESKTVELPVDTTFPAVVDVTWAADDDVRVSGTRLGNGYWNPSPKTTTVTVGQRLVTVDLIDSVGGNAFGWVELSLGIPADTGAEGDVCERCPNAGPTDADGLLRFYDGQAVSGGDWGSGVGLQRDPIGRAPAGTTAYFGNGWSQTAAPSAAVYGPDPSAPTDIAVSFGGTDTRVFRNTSNPGAALVYRRANAQGSSNTLALSDGQIVFRTVSGSTLTFEGHGAAVPAARRGQLISRTDASGNRLEQSFNSDGSPSQFRRFLAGQQTALEIRDFVYATAQDDAANVGKVKQIDIKRGDGTLVRRVSLAYYASGSSFGARGDLRSMTVVNGGGDVVDERHYRYTAANGGSLASGESLLQYTFDVEAVRRAKAAGLDMASVPSASLALYATNSYEYDLSNRVVKHDKQAAGCSSCAGGIGRFTYAYARSTARVFDIHRDWRTKLTETRPDRSERIVYANSRSQPILEVIRMPDGVGFKQYGTYTRYDERGLPIWVASPEAVDLPSDLAVMERQSDLVNGSTGNCQYIIDDRGLIEVTNYATGTTATAATPGSVARLVESTAVRRGEKGAAVMQEAVKYVVQPRSGSNGGSIAVVASRTTYPGSSTAGEQTTTYVSTFEAGTTRIVGRTTTRPVVSTVQNGSGVADVVDQIFDAAGREVWSRDGDGFLRYTAYDPQTGAVVRTIVDVDTNRGFDFVNLPAGWRTPTGGGLHLVSTFTVDQLGRMVSVTDPRGNVTRTVYDDVGREVRVYPGVSFPTPSTWRTTGPIEVVRRDVSGTYSESLTFLPDPVAATMPLGTERIANLQSLTRSQFNSAGQLTEVDRYTSFEGIAYSTVTATLGTEGVNYLRTRYGYNNQGQVDRIRNPAGTITIFVYDGMGRLASRWVGTNDSTSNGRKWSEDNRGPLSNMTRVAAYEYDNGGTGNGLLTRVTEYPGGSSPDRVTRNAYDWRGRLVIVKEGATDDPNTEAGAVNRSLTYTDYDNLDRVTGKRVYDGDTVAVVDSDSDGIPDVPSANALRSSQVLTYDALDRVFRTQQLPVDQATGAVGTARLTSDVFYDRRGNVAATYSPNAPVTQSRYDGASRLAVSYTLGNVPAATWANATSVTSSLVVEQTDYSYDPAGNVILTANRQRFDDASATAMGALGTPTTGIRARVSYNTSYYDAANRLTATVDLGTNGGSPYIRPELLPARTDTSLVTSYAYDDLPQTIESSGAVTLTVDSAGKLCANRTRINADYGGVSYREMINSGFTAVAADTIDGRNRLVWRLPDGALHIWELDSNWVATSGFGRQMPGSADHSATEVSFAMDFDGNGKVGSESLIEAVGSVSLTVDSAGMLRANGRSIRTSSASVSYAAMISQGYTAVAAERVFGQNLIAWRLSDGTMHFWRTDDAWTALSGFGRQIPGSPEHDTSERAFGVDFDRNGTIGTATAIESTGAVQLTTDTSGILCANRIRITTDRGGLAASDLSVAGYVPLAVDTINGRNILALRNGSQIELRQLDASWKVVPSNVQPFVTYTVGSVAFFDTEVSFGMDFDRDGYVGLNNSASADGLRDSNGVATLTADFNSMLRVKPTVGGASSGKFLAPAGVSSARAAETIAGQNVVAYSGNGSVVIEVFDASWNRAGFPLITYQEGSAEYQSMELCFQQDFDGDGAIGVAGPRSAKLPNGGVTYRDMTDPRGITTRTVHDAAFRTTATIANFTGRWGTSQADVSTLFTFDSAGRLASRTAVQPSGTPSQVTGYVYGVSPASGSTISSNDILAETRYPDPTTGVASAAERDTYTANALGERIGITDRAGTARTFTYDATGRRTSDAITVPAGSVVGGAVRRIESAYDVMGRLTRVTSFNAATGGSVLNEVARAFNGFGQMTSEQQAHTGPVDAATTPQVRYAYSQGTGGNHCRLTGITYPAGYQVNSTYTGIDSALSRPTSLTGSAAGTSTAVTLEAFKYLGAGTVVERSRPEVNVTLSMASLSGTTGDAGDKYTGLDRFGRVVDQRWTQGTTATSTVVDRYGYTYDRNSNRLTRSNALAAAFSESYAYDALNQLQSFTRGSGTTPTQQWQFDALGNWTSLTTNSVAQTRTANAQNEVTQVGGAVLAYSRTGTLTTDAQGRTLVYDGWNRLVTVRNAAGTEIARYEYDGLNRRIVEQVGSPSSPAAATAPVRDVYYSQDWQVIEERIRAASGVIPTTADTRFIWSPVYVDALIARDRNADADTATGTGGLEERVYALQDANWNTSAIVAAAGVTGVAGGTVISRFAYTPYGESQTLTASWAPPAAGTTPATPWAHLFQGLEVTDVTGLAHARNRDYSASLGRFITLDPIGFQAGDNNWYRFVENGPTGKLDPSGLFADLAIEIVSIGTGVWSFATNVGAGAWWAAAADAGGIVVDVGMAIVPGAPGVTGLGLKAGREATERVAREAAEQAAREAAEQAARAAREAAEKAAKDGGKCAGPVRGGAQTPVSQGAGRAAKQGTPNSIYEQVDGAGNVRSRTFYDENGRSFARQDFDHAHGGLQPHEHLRNFDSHGRPISRETVRRVPSGYDNSPSK